jgi:hypothetical protein
MILENRIKFIKDVVENGKQGTWNDYAIKYDLKDAKQASDFYRYYQRTGQLAPDYEEDLVDPHPDYYAGILDSEIPKGAKVKKAWGKPGSMMVSMDFSEMEEESKEDRIIEKLKNFSPKKLQINPARGGKFAAVLSTPDLHYGKGPLGKTSEALFTAVGDVLSRINLDNVEKFILPIGNDILNSEAGTRATTKGTPQFDSADYDECFDHALGDMISLVDRLSDIAPVEVFFIHGNHDRATSFYLGRALEGYMYNNPNVKIEASTEPRKYAKYGQTGFMFEHGELKANDYPLLFAAEEPKLWGECKYKEALLGHLHHQDTKEINGFMIRILPSLCPMDKWHKKHGYLATRAVQLYLYDKEIGFTDLLEYRVV